MNAAHVLRRLGATGIAALALATSGFPLTSASASAPQAESSALVVCSGTETATHDPGITYTPQDIHAHVETRYSGLLGCDATSTVDGTIENATCLDARIAELPEDIYWSGGQETHVEYSDVVIATGGPTVVVTAVGTATAGKYAGRSVERVVTILDSQLTSCSSPEGMTRMSGLSELTIV